MPHLIRHAAVLVAAACGLAVLVRGPATAGAQSPPAGLEPGQAWSGDLYSTSGSCQLWIGGGDATEFHLVNKQDCYQVEYVNAWEAVVPPASIPSGAEHLVMQTGGNLVVYSASNRPLWNTGTATGKRSYLVVYAPPALIVSLVNGGPVWRWN